MCGLFGSIGLNPNESTLRTLAVLNEDRGSHAFGLFSSDGLWLKWAEKATKCLADKEFSGWLSEKASSCWFIAGHTRWATAGSSFKTGNAHPFCYNDTVGSHNGSIDAPLEYEVDSMYMFDLLEKNSQDYQKALENVSGSFTLTWTDSKSFYILSNDNELHLAVGRDGVWYYSSTLEHLEIALGPLEDHEVTVVDSGKVLRFDFEGGLVGRTIMDKFVSIAEPRWQMAKTTGKKFGAQYPAYDDAGLDRFYSKADYLNEDRVPDETDIERLTELSALLEHTDTNNYNELWDEYMELVETCKDIYDFEDDKPMNIHSMSDQQYMEYEMRCNNRFDDMTEQVRIMV